MGDKISLKIEARTLQGKKVKQLRKQGLTPAVVYGAGIEAMAVQAETGVIKKVVAEAGKHTPVYLTGDKKRIAMIKDVDFNPAKRGEIRHVSFHAVKADELVYAEVPVTLVGIGESEAERAGLVVLQAIDRIEVRALPMELPDAIEIDITKMAEPGDKVTLGDAKIPEGVELVERDSGHHEEDEERPLVTDLVVAGVYEPAALEAANAAVAGAAETADASEVEVEPGSDTTEASAPADDK